MQTVQTRAVHQYISRWLCALLGRKVLCGLWRYNMQSMRLWVSAFEARCNTLPRLVRSASPTDARAFASPNARATFSRAVPRSIACANAGTTHTNAYAKTM